MVPANRTNPPWSTGPEGSHRCRMSLPHVIKTIASEDTRNPERACAEFTARRGSGTEAISRKV